MVIYNSDIFISDYLSVWLNSVLLKRPLITYLYDDFMIQMLVNISASFIIGFLLFSPNYVNLPFPFNSFELMLVSFCVFYRKHLNFDFYRWKGIVIIGILFILLFIRGIEWNNANDFSEIYRMSRAWMLIVLFAYIFYKSDLLNSNFIYWTAFGSVFGGIMMGIHGLKIIEIDNTTTYLCPNIIAIPFFVYLSFGKSNLLKLISFGAIFTMGALSQTRGIILYCILSYVISYYVYVKAHKKNLLNKYILFIFIGFLSLYIVYQRAEDKVSELSPYLYYRLYDKVENAGSTGEDQKRINAYMHYVDNVEDYFLPHGFYLRRGALEWNNARARGVNDSGILDLIHTYGWILLGCIVYYFLSYLKSLIRLLGRNEYINVLFAVSLFIPFSLLMGYAIFSAPFTACFWGIYIAMLSTYIKRNYKSGKV